MGTELLIDGGACPPSAEQAAPLSKEAGPPERVLALSTKLGAAAVLLSLFLSSGCFVTAATWCWAVQPVDPVGPGSRSRSWLSKPKTPEARQRRILLAAVLTPLTVACDVAIITAIVQGDCSGLDGFSPSFSGGPATTKEERRRASEAKRRARERKRLQATRKRSRPYTGRYGY